MKYKISIIIPVFNVENYINEALESIIRQTIGFGHLEVIMVNDCSTDKSGEIIEDYAAKYENFTAIHLPENSGFAGRPRNVGMERATGEYLMFLDPDDYYADDACEVLYNKITSENADIITGKFNILFENGKMINASSWYQLYSCSVPEIKNMKTEDNKKLLYSAPPSVMTKIFKRDFIEKNNIIFPEGVPGEDLAFAVHCFLKTDEIIYINKNTLTIRKRETENKSVTFIIDNRYINGSIQAYAYIDQICIDAGKEEEFPLIMEYRFPYWLNQFILSDLTTSEKKKALKSIRPLLKKYHESGLTLPDHFMPISEYIVNKKFKDAILLFDQLRDSKKSQEKNVSRSKVISQNEDIKSVSIIIVTHNNHKTMKKTILSVLNSVYQDKVELIVLDDNSTDNTVTIIEKISKNHKNLKLVKLENNSENLSTIRNIGIEEANGKYITFLDQEYNINIDNLLKMVEYANIHDLDCVKGYIKVVNDNKIEYTDVIDCNNKNQLEVIKNIIAGESVLNIVTKKEFLIENNIRFNKNYELGIETLFYADLFAYKPRIEHYNSYIYKRNDIKNLSSTQKYQDKELDDYINVWELTEKTLKKIGISYYELRLPIEVKNTIRSIILYSSCGISNGSFNKLNAFLNENISYLKNKVVLPERYELIFNSIIDKDYEKFLKLSKKRLLVAGHDLKFIESALKYLKNDYNIKIDEWTSHTSHDEKKSMELLNWADFIFCEWLLGNSVWYSRSKMDHQQLIIRAHKFELSQDFGNQVDFGNVDGVIAITYYFLELFSNIFKIPRQKMILLSNYIETSIYTGVKTDDFKHNLAIVGYIPRWKGLIKGLKILKMLKENDDKFKLYLMGKHYTEVNWVWNNPKDRSYFQECENFIKENNLEDSVIFKGWTERSKMFNSIGYVLSVSDIEGSHQAPAEGLADSTLAFLLNWEGVEYVYPKEIIFENMDDIKNMILLTYKDDDKYYNLLKKMNDYVINEFNVEKFVDELKIEFRKIALLN